MISREWIEPAIAAAVEEWYRGRKADTTLASQGVPDLSVVPGYSLEDVRDNCIGLLSPAQKRQATKALLYKLVGVGVGSAFMVFIVARGGGFGPFIALIVFGFVALKALFDFLETRSGPVSQVDGDIWTELQQDSESSDRYFVHIDDIRLQITKQAFGALVAGGPYRFYYVRGAELAVGGLVLPGWRSLPEPEPKKRSWWSRISIEV